MPKRTCSVEGCERPHSARGFCKVCYYRLRRAGVLKAERPGPPKKPWRACSIEGCTQTARCRGWCDTHYTRWKRHADPLGWGFAPIEERFWDKVVKTEDCWYWQGYCQPKGYGVFAWPGGYLAHRYAYTLLVGAIPEGLEVDHTCRTRCCVRPDHLEAVDHRENIRRAWARA